MNPVFRLACTLLITVALSRAAYADISIYVSPGGDDKADGGRYHPLQHIEAARDRLRAQGHPRGAHIVLETGNYWLNAPLEFTNADSGVTLTSARHADARLVGGVLVAPDKFLEISDDEVIKRLAPEAKGKVVWADLAALGFSESAPFPDLSERPPVAPELFFGGARQTLARWPNEGWAEVAEVIESGPAPWRKYESDKSPVFRYEGDRPARWNTADGVWLQGYWCFDWHIETVKVASISAAAHEITLAAQPAYGLGSGNAAKRRYAVLNVLEELDMPGEYCLDWHAHRLYFWPPADLHKGEAVLSRVQGAVVSLKDCDAMTIEGLTVEMGQDTGISVQGGEGVTIKDTTVRNLGLQGIDVDGGKKHTVDGCNIYNTGTGGLRMAGGDRKKLLSCGHRATNNHIYSVGRRQRTHADHVDLAGVGIYFAHNLLNDGPHQSIYVAGNNHIIEYNEIHHVGMESDDCGAFYMGRNPSERGNIVRYNYFHDIGSSYSLGSCAIYLDDGAGGQKIYGNIFSKAAGGTFGAIFVHGGHDNIAENNIFIDCKRPLGASAWNDDNWREWVNGDLWKKALREDVDITSPVYISSYPELAHFFTWEEYAAAQPCEAQCLLQLRGANEWELDDVKNLTTKDDPGFEDAAHGRFTLKRHASVLKELPGFVPPPFSEWA